LASPETQVKQIEKFRAASGKKYKSPKAAIKAAHKVYAAFRKRGFKDGTPLDRAAKNLSEGATTKMHEQPGSGGTRSFMRQTVQRAVEKLKEIGYDVTPADLQATVWFPEKELHGALNIGGGRSAPDDYAAAAKRLLESRNE
jgi:hypothetical protein